MHAKHTTPTNLTIPAQIGNVKGNTIVITGGANGLGEAMVEYFAGNG
jgi:hypothetical protein